MNRSFRKPTTLTLPNGIVEIKVCSNDSYIKLKSESLELKKVEDVDLAILSMSAFIKIFNKK